MEKRVIEFIIRRWGKDANWLDGNCYYFARILKDRFPEMSIYYAPILGHFCAGYEGVYYDWTGVFTKEVPILFESIKENDPSWYDRIVRDCIL